MEEIKVKYFTDDIDELCYVEGKSDWIDLHAAETVTMKAGEFRLIPLGVAIALPEGYEAHIVPRSSTFKNYGILQTNSMGVVDYTYRGDGDQWRMPAYATRDVTIEKNARICQFINPVCHAALIHQRAAEDKQRNRYHDEAVHRGKHRLHRHAQRQIRHRDNRNNRGCSEGNRDRHAQKHQHDKKYKKN